MRKKMFRNSLRKNSSEFREKISSISESREATNANDLKLLSSARMAVPALEMSRSVKKQFRYTFLIPLFLWKYFYFNIFCFIYFFTNKLTNNKYIHSRRNLIFFLSIFSILSFPLQMCASLSLGLWSATSVLVLKVTAWKIPSRRGKVTRNQHDFDNRTSQTTLSFFIFRLLLIFGDSHSAIQMDTSRYFSQFNFLFNTLNLFYPIITFCFFESRCEEWMEEKRLWNRNESFV